MKQAEKSGNFTLFLLTVSMVLLLALGVYAANRLANHWLLTNNVNQMLAQISSAISKSGHAGEFSQLISERNAAASVGQSPNLHGMRLSRSDPAPNSSTQTAPAPKVTESQLSSMMRVALAGALAPSKIISVYIAGADELTANTPLSPQLADFVKASDLPESALRKTLTQLPTAKISFTSIDVDWLGQFNKRSFVVVPHFFADKVDGAMIIVADHTPQIASLEVITKIGSVIIAALCFASFALAAFLLWMRFHDQVKTNQDIEFLAHHDPLTGLPNRAVFNARLTEALRLVHAKASNMGVMLIDVDKFKEINDTHGHGTGDIFLQVIADRLRAVFGDHLVARLSGDEFAVMIKSVSDVARLTKLASDMIAATKVPSNIDGKEIKISLSIGIARASDGSWRSSRLLHCADLALYRAKHSGRSTFAWYTAEMDADAQKRKEIEEGLVKALRLDQFEVLYQPQYSLIDNKLKAYESLIRWEHPSKGTISPDLFIPVAEDCGLIEAIGDWVLFHACREAASWSDQSLRVAVNVSAAQFKPGVTEQKVAQALQDSGLAPERLEIEITESLLIANTNAVVATLNNIREMGVSIAMDDFGTGYSSLSYLSRFPFDKIKIDRSFIKPLGKNASTDAIVTSIIGLGRSLDVQITAEGVENQEQVTLLRAAGCNLVQGYLLGRPDSVQAHENFRARQAEDPTVNNPLIAMTVTPRNTVQTVAESEPVENPAEPEAERPPADAASNGIRSIAG